MTVGLPGAGIGGLFYLASTFLLPFRCLYRSLRGRPIPSGKHISQSVAIATGVVVSLWITGWLLASIIPRDILQSVSSSAAGASRARTVLPVATFAMAAGTLSTVLLTVEIVRYVRARREPDLSRGRNGS